ncbi:MAG TPA: DUF5946 family protein [Gammaproteobacteria bacterium]
MARCPGCGAEFPEREGPVHRYMESSPACWAAYGEVLAREYSDPTYFQVHRLSVDAYAVQHPGKPSPQTIQSVAVHLIRLCLLLERDLPMERANAAMLIASEQEERYVWLLPPASLGALTVADVKDAVGAEDHMQRVRAWATCAWDAWSPHHLTIKSWLPKGY